MGSPSPSWIPLHKANRDIQLSGVPGKREGGKGKGNHDGMSGQDVTREELAWSDWQSKLWFGLLIALYTHQVGVLSKSVIYYSLSYSFLYLLGRVSSNSIMNKIFKEIAFWIQFMIKQLFTYMSTPFDLSFSIPFYVLYMVMMFHKGTLMKPCQIHTDYPLVASSTHICGRKHKSKYLYHVTEVLIQSTCLLLRCVDKIICKMCHLM